MAMVGGRKCSLWRVLGTLRSVGSSPGGESATGRFHPGVRKRAKQPLQKYRAYLGDDNRLKI